jgi:hypothetical protein
VLKSYTAAEMVSPSWPHLHWGLPGRFSRNVPTRPHSMLNASRRYGTAMQGYGRRSLTHFGEALARIVGARCGAGGSYTDTHQARITMALSIRSQIGTNGV